MEEIGNIVSIQGERGPIDNDSYEDFKLAFPLSNNEGEYTWLPFPFLDSATTPWATPKRATAVPIANPRMVGV